MAVRGTYFYDDGAGSAVRIPWPHVPPPDACKLCGGTGKTQRPYDNPRTCYWCYGSGGAHVVVGPVID